MRHPSLRRGQITKKIEEQHREARKKNKKVDNTAIDKKIEQVVELVADHIVKGNDLKVLSLPAPSGDEEGKEKNRDESSETTGSLRENSMKVRRELKALPPKDYKKLLGMYGKPTAGE